MKSELIELYPGIFVPNDTEYLAEVMDILENPVTQSMAAFCQHGETSCLAHSITVSYLSYTICKKKNFDYRSAARAGLLHDMFLYDWHKTPMLKGKVLPHGFTHPRTALNNAKMFFELNEKEHDIILKHMWPMTVVPPKSKEAYVVCMMDKICSVRETFRQSFLEKRLATAKTLKAEL